MTKKTDEYRLIFSKILGRTIRNLRESAEMSQEKLGRQADVSRITLGKWENGKVLPDIYELYKTIGEICPNQASFWESFEGKFDPIFQEMEKAADLEKYREYMQLAKKKERNKR
ncbi:MAG: helix-turn-helix transcriptional regulator [Fibrobacter sp.]|uniref:helix-turn-helix transcriptional regulator n=1 Tax=Fibrobacter sp. TaxID=35828 RepID=UPI003890C373|nr:helix-turn-helix transcriptional regulator [Fibrobacter sp.]